MHVANEGIVYRIKQIADRHPTMRAVLAPVIYPRRAFMRVWFSRRVLLRAQDSLFAEPPLLSVPEFKGCFRVGTRSDAFRRLFLHGRYEPILAALCERLIDRSRDAVDIGANIGLYSVLCAKLTSGRVLAVEPTDNALRLLRENIESNGVNDRVTIVEGVVSDQGGVITLNFVNGQEEYSSIGEIKHPSIGGAVSSQKEVASITLDELVERSKIDPGFIKVDVEGAEQRVLNGGLKTLREARPILMSEFSPQLLRENGVIPDSILHSLRDLGYRLIDPCMPRLPLGRRNFGDLLGVPEESYSDAELTELVWDAHEK